MRSSFFKWEKGFAARLMRLSIPVAIQSVVASSMQIIDNLMISNLPTDIPMAAVTQANRISYIFQMMMFGVINSVSIFVSQYWGRHDLKGVRRTMGVGSTVAFIISLIVAVPALCCPEFLARFFLKDTESIRLAGQYLGVMGFTYFFQAQSLTQAAVLKSTEQVKLPMFASVFAILTNVLLNWLLIFDHGSFGGYGVRGAAIATCIGAAVELAILVFFSYRYQFATAARLKELLPKGRAFVKRFFVIAIPVMLNEGLWGLGTVMYSAVYGRLGDGIAPAAAVGIYTNFEQIAFIAVRALCHASGVMIGMALGSGEYDRAKTYAKRFLFLTPMVMEVLALIIFCLRGPLVSIFSAGPEVASIAKDLIAIYAACAWTHAVVCVVVVSVLRTGGDVRAAALIDLVPLWCFGVPLVALLGLVLKLDIRVVYLATVVEQVSKTFLCIWRMKKNKWVRTIGQEEPSIL